ncbi:pentapeptide repeat-containing protein [Streptomyces longwoodensis]|uniref:pentapeptide repeat-containing protein n=1 Tax=Streptomyces longwoodensis TaxID=68231 RepID=UPI00386C9C44
MVTAIGALIFTGVSIQQVRLQNEVAESGQVTDRFNAAIGNLASDSTDIRLGGIYALKRLMHDSPRDQPEIVTVLAAYIRGHDRPLKKRPSLLELDTAKNTSGVSLHLVPDDVEAAVRVIADRDPDNDGMAHRGLVAPAVDLSGAHLEGIDLSDASFEFANFSGAHLDYARLRDVDLTAANFDDASLRHTDLGFSDISYASFRESQLGESEFDYTQAKGADFSGAISAHFALESKDIREAYFVRTDLCQDGTPKFPKRNYRCREHLT